MATAKDWPLQVFYDGACPLCNREVAHYRKRDVHHHIEWMDIAASTFAAEDYGLDADRLQQAMHARTADGKVFTEVRAFVKIWQALPWGIWTGILRVLLKVPGMMALAGVLYRLFARNRYRLTGRCTPERCTLPEK